MGTRNGRPLILGIGSPFGADRAGWEAIRLLRVAGLAGVRLEVCDRPGARLLSLLEGTPAAILIDAFVSDEQAGTLRRIELSTLALGDPVSDHGFGVAEALALCAALGSLPGALALIGISVAGGQPPPMSATALVGLVYDVLHDMGYKEDGLTALCCKDRTHPPTEP